MIEELEDEVLEMRSMAVRAGAAQLKQLQDENKKLSAELSDLKSKNDDLLRDTSKLIRHHSWIEIKFISIIRIEERVEFVAAERSRIEAPEDV